MSKVGPFTLGTTLYRDGNFAYVKGESSKAEPLLLIFISDKVIGPSKENTDELIPAQSTVEFSFVKEPARTGVRGVLPLVARGKFEGMTILGYPWVEAVPFYVHMKTVPTIHRRIVLTYVLEVARIINGLHKAGYRSTEVNIGNVFVDEKEQVYLLCNTIGDDEGFVSETLKVHPQIKRFDVVSPEEVWGNGADEGTDIFQTGALAVTLLTRRTLKLSSNIRKMGFQAAVDGFYPPEDFTEGLPKAFGKCIKKCLQPDPLDRYETAEELLDGLNKVEEMSKITDAVSEVMHKGFVKPDVAASLSKKNDTEAPEESADDLQTEDMSGESPPLKVPAKKRTSKPLKKATTSKATPAAGFTIPPELESYKIPAIGGVLLVFILCITLGIGGGDTTPVPTKQPTRTAPRPTKKATTVKQPTKKPTKSSGSTSPKGKSVIDVSSITADLNGVIARPTDKSTYAARKALLQKCYKMLPREHRGKAIRSSVFQLLYEHERKDKEQAYKFVDETFSKYYDYLRANNAKM